MSSSFPCQIQHNILRTPLLRCVYQVLTIVLTLPLYLLGFFVPKNKNIWVFANFFGYCDNCRYLFEYVRQHHPEITPVWIHIRTNEVPPDSTDHFFRFSITGILYQYRAGLVFLSTGKGDLARWTLAGKTIIQLWHGIPIKKILLDSPETIPFVGNTLIAGRIASRFLHHNLNRYSLVITSSEKVRQRMASAFGLGRKKIAVTGYPRHDIILEHANDPKQRIVYAPTWRPDLSAAKGIIREICNQGFISKLNRLGYELWVSIHPLNEPVKTVLGKELTQNIVFVGDEDINLVLAQSAILITDYSSVAIDFSILDRPLVFFAPDFNEYLSSRGLYPEFETIIRNHAVTTPEEVLEIIRARPMEQVIDRKRYFRYHDTSSRQRIVQLVMERYLAGGNTSAGT